MSTSNTTTQEYVHHVAHHFDSAEEEYRTSKFGLWVFLMTEILMFGGLFVGYIIFRGIYSEAFAEASKFLDWRLGAINTVVLIFSSLTMVLSIYYAQHNQKAKVLLNLYITFFCGVIFMCIKAYEYAHKIHEGLLPGHMFHYSEQVAAHAPLYFSFYFCMTGMHGIHVMVGMGFILWLIRRAHRGEFSSNYFTPLECVGLFWHLVDLIWIYLFPLLYLVG
jgi:cytochrome c oxidase subunit 3